MFVKIITFHENWIQNFFNLKTQEYLWSGKSKSFVNCRIKLGKSWGEHELHMLVGIYFMRIKNLMVKAQRSMNSAVEIADRGRTIYILVIFDTFVK